MTALVKAHLKELNSPVVNDSCALKCIADQLILDPFLQVTEETSIVLRKLGYSCDCRGFINVKGKGELKTFFVCTDASKQQSMGLSWGPLRPELIDSCALHCWLSQWSLAELGSSHQRSGDGCCFQYHLCVFTISTDHCCCLWCSWRRVCVDHTHVRSRRF